MKYDIFISYRRKDSSGRSNVATARQFKMAFEGPPYNYKVFFDYSECTDNYFSDIILPAIRTCDFFVLVLTKDSLLRCSNEGDWVRREIEEAIAYKRKIIPITPDKECEAFPTSLPDSLRKALEGLQITTIYTDHMFEACVDFLVKNRFHLGSDKLKGDKAQKAEQERREKELAEAERLAKEAAEKKRLEEERRAEEERRKAEQERIAAEKLQNNARQETTNSFNGHEYVDLGLPSGTLWATCNIGAKKPEDYGDYLSWNDGKTAAANWGNGWRMPTGEQWKELQKNTKSTWTTRNGVNGRLFMANNGNSLFLPASGYRYEGSLNDAGGLGLYWSSSLHSGSPYSAWYFYFGSGGYFGMLYNYRFRSHSVRAVRSMRQT